MLYWGSFLSIHTQKNLKPQKVHRASPLPDILPVYKFWDFKLKWSKFGLMYKGSCSDWFLGNLSLLFLLNSVRIAKNWSRDIKLMFWWLYSSRFCMRQMASFHCLPTDSGFRGQSPNTTCCFACNTIYLWISSSISLEKISLNLFLAAPEMDSVYCYCFQLFSLVEICLTMPHVLFHPLSCCEARQFFTFTTTWIFKITFPIFTFIWSSIIPYSGYCTVVKHPPFLSTTATLITLIPDLSILYGLHQVFNWLLEWLSPTW